jgi:ankyrin repeat protein
VDSIEKYPLHLAGLGATFDEVQELIRGGSDINEFDEFGNTPLHYAAAEERLEIVQLLLEAGANVNAADERTIGNTPLGNVAGRCSFALAKILVDAGADPNVPGWMQITSLQRASDRDDEEGLRVHALLSQDARG